MMFRAARPFIFRLDAERAHWLTVHALASAPWAAGWTADPVDDPVTLMGLRFRNRVGLAAGMDKDGIALEGWQRLGFGFAEVGTVTPRAQPGNPKPRIFRDVGSEAIINRLGFNNGGVDACVQRVAQHRAKGMLVGINIGRNKDTPAEQAVEDYRYGFEAVYPVADYITINISSPNTPG
ncbi:MAG: dihydroorotate dehydrogenase (quinone), partial [Algiphilus sp.]